MRLGILVGQAPGLAGPGGQDWQGLAQILQSGAFRGSGIPHVANPEETYAAQLTQLQATPLIAICFCSSDRVLQSFGRQLTQTALLAAGNGVFQQTREHPSPARHGRKRPSSSRPLAKPNLLVTAKVALGRPLMASEVMTDCAAFLLLLFLLRQPSS